MPTAYQVMQPVRLNLPTDHPLAFANGTEAVIEDVRPVEDHQGEPFDGPIYTVGLIRGAPINLTVEVTHDQLRPIGASE